MVTDVTGEVAVAEVLFAVEFKSQSFEGSSPNNFSSSSDGKNNGITRSIRNVVLVSILK